MILTLALTILIVWAILAFVVSVGGWLIHLLLIAALAAIVYHFLAGHRHSHV